MCSGISATRRRRTRRLVGAFALAGAFGLSGCVESAIREPRAPAGPAERAWTNTFLWGLVGRSEVDVRNYCAAPAASVKAGGDVLSTVLGIVSLGLYLPRVVVVECSRRGTSASAAPGDAK